MVDRHKVFISYSHKYDQKYKDQLFHMNEECNIFDDYSVREGDIDDQQLSDEQIRRIIRDEYIRNASVLLLLCGSETKKRKHIDWEIHAAMFDTEKNPKMGILIINLPFSGNKCRASNDEEKNIISPNAAWYKCEGRAEYEKSFPSMPSRIIDNFVKDVPISVVDWDRVVNNPVALMQLIDFAFGRRKTNLYDHSVPLRRNNS